LESERKHKGEERGGSSHQHAVEGKYHTINDGREKKKTRALETRKEPQQGEFPSSSVDLGAQKLQQRRITGTRTSRRMEELKKEKKKSHKGINYEEL